MHEKDKKILAEKEADLEKANNHLNQLKQKLDDQEPKIEEEPHFSSRSSRFKSPNSDSEEQKSKPQSKPHTRNTSGGLTPSRLVTIQEDEQEQQATISPSQATTTTKQDEEESKASTATKSVIPSLNLNSDNLRKKTSENMKQDVKRIRQQQVNHDVEKDATAKAV